MKKPINFNFKIFSFKYNLVILLCILIAYCFYIWLNTKFHLS